MSDFQFGVQTHPMRAWLTEIVAATCSRLDPTEHLARAVNVPFLFLRSMKWFLLAFAKRNSLRGERDDWRSVRIQRLELEFAGRRRTVRDE